jgi:EpsI family protein
MHGLKPYLPAAILFGGSVLLADARSQATAPLTGPINSVMSVAPGYKITEQTLSPEEQRVAGMTEYVARTYVREHSVAFTTFVSYYNRQTHGKTIHSPRNCLPGAGWEIMSSGTQVVVVDGSSQVVNRYVLKKGRATAVAYYWYQGRGRVTANEYVVKWNLLRDAALFGRTEEALVRVVVPIPLAALASGTVDDMAAFRKADATAQDVAARLIADVGVILPARRLPSS